MIINIILPISLLLFFADCFFLNYLWMNFNDKLFNMCAIFWVLFFVINIVCIVVKLVVSVPKEEKNKRLKSSVYVALITVLLVGAGGFFVISSNAKEVSGYTYISAKETAENGDCFLVIKDLGKNNYVRVKCDRKAFDEIETDQNTFYTVTYRVGCFNKYGVLGGIDKA